MKNPEFQTPHTFIRVAGAHRGWMKMPPIHYFGVLITAIIAFASSSTRANAAEEIAPTFTSKEIENLSKLPKIPQRQKRKPGELAFAVFSFGKDGEDYFYLRDEKPERVLFNTGVVRRFQFGGEEGRLVIYKRMVNEEGEAKLVPVARVTPPSGSRDGIVLFKPSEDDGTKEANTPRYVDLSKKAFRTNDVRLINLTPAKLMVQLGDKTVKLSPMKDLVGSQRVDAQIYTVKVGMEMNEKLKLIYSNILQTEPENRVMLMIVPDWTSSSAGSPIRCMIYKDGGSVEG
jgi:hypothetical protein